MNRTAAILTAIAGAVIAILAVLLLRPAAKPPVQDALTIEEARQWTYDKNGVWIGDLTILADHPALPITAPGVSVKMKNSTADRMMIALSVVLFDEDGGLIASAYLNPPTPGIIEPSESKTVSAWLPVPSADIPDIRYVKLRVTRAAVHEVPGGDSI